MEDTDLKKVGEEAIESIYEEKKLSFDEIKKNPILKPISEINKSFINFELIIRRAMLEYEKTKKEINQMIELQPKYSETMVMGKIQNILTYIPQIIHSQQIQKENMKDAINEMIKIVKVSYGVLDEEKEMKIESKENNQIEDIKIINTEKEKEVEIKEKFIQLNKQK